MLHDFGKGHNNNMPEFMKDEAYDPAGGGHWNTLASLERINI